MFRRGDCLEEFESVSEGVGGIKPLEAGEWLVIDNLYSTVDQPTTEILEILDVERGMGFARRSEILIDSEMNSNAIGFEPAPATGFQMTRLFNFGDSQHALVKGDRPPLPLHGHRQLDVMKTEKAHLHEYCQRRVGRHLNWSISLIIALESEFGLYEPL